MAGKTVLEKVMSLKQWQNKYQALSLRFKEKEQALKEKDKLLKEYQTAIQKSSQLIKETRQKLSLELKLAHQIHRLLLPSELPVISGSTFSFKFQPATAETSLGKDFYEINPHPRHKSFSLLLSSSLSHSLCALLFSARLKMMNYIGKKPFLPDKFLSQLKEELKNDQIKLFKKPSQPWNKISLFYALINQKTYQMSYALTGDIKVFKLCAKSKEVRLLKKPTSSLQKSPPTLELNGGDKVIILSPGVFKPWTNKEKVFSLDKVKKIIKEEYAGSAHEIRNRIFYELKAFSEGKPLKSDQSVLVMEVKHKILKLASSD